MLANLFKVALRNLLRNGFSSAINIFGLCLGMTFSLLIMIWVVNEKSFDSFHKDYKDIHLLLNNVSSSAGGTQTLAGVSPLTKQSILNSVPEVQAVTQLYISNRWPNDVCFKRNTEEGDCLYRMGIYADSAFYDVFSFEILRGTPDFLKGYSIGLTQTTAKELFGDEEPMGKKLFIDFFEVEVGAVLADAPENSSIQFNYIMSMDVVRKLRGLTEEKVWNTYSLDTYLKTAKGSDPKIITEKINSDKTILSNKQLDEGLSFLVYPLEKWHLNNQFADGKAAGGKIEYVIIFTVIAFVILLMASINYVNLTTAKSTTRRKEIGVRKSVGANNWQLSLQFFGESFLTAGIALILAIGLTQLILPYFNQVMDLNLVLNLSNQTILIVLALFLVSVSLLAGIYPALILASFNPIKALKDKFSTELTGSSFIRKGLIVIQITASLSIIIFASVLFTQINFISSRNLGYDKENVIMIEPTYKLLQSYEKFKNDLTTAGGIRSVTVGGGEIYSLPYRRYNYEWPGKSGAENMQFKIYGCYEDFVSGFDLKILEGENFNAADSSDQVLLTREAVKQMQLEDPVGDVFKIEGSELLIKGVIEDFHSESLKEELAPVILIHRYPTQLTHLYVHYSGNASAAIETITNAYNEVEPYFSVRYKFMDESFDRQYKDELMTEKLSTIFITISLVIALIGVIGLSIFNLSGKVKEIAVRKIFGATIPRILSLVSKDFIILCLIANLIAWPVSWYVANAWLSGYAYRVEVPIYLYVAIGVGLTIGVLLIVGFLGLRAARENPVNSLRYE